MSPYLTIVIPSYNESIRLRKSLPGVRDYLLKQMYTWEVLVIDDGSLDDTSAVASEIFHGAEARVIRNSRNRGKGYSVRRGVLESRGELVLLTDADFSTPISEFEKLKMILEEKRLDIVIGSRALPESQIVEKQAWYRQSMGWFFNVLVQMLVLKGFKDTQCGFKCFRRETTSPVFSRMRIDRFSFDVELLFIARKLGLKIQDTPVEWKNVLFSRVQIVKDSARMFFDLLVIRWNDFRGLYD